MRGEAAKQAFKLIIGRHRKSSFVITSNRTVEEWLGLFDDPTLGNSALDRVANASYPWSAPSRYQVGYFPPPS